MKHYVRSLFVPFTAIILGLLIGAIIMWVSGYDAIAGYGKLWNGIFGSVREMGEVVRKATPLILAGLAVAFAFKTGLFNIGVEGQVLMGFVASVWIGTAFDLPMIIHLPLAIVVAMIAGSLWAFLPGLLKAWRGVHEVVVTIMMNYIALIVSGFLVREVLTDMQARTPNVHESASLKSQFLKDLTSNSSMHWGIILSLIAVIVVWYLIERTTKGYELRAVGMNKYASQYAGINVNRNIIYSMMISGALAGLAGAMEGLGGYGYMSIPAGFTGVGFNGIAVALLGAGNPLGILFSAFLFAGLQVGGSNYFFTLEAPSEIIDVVIATIIFFVAIKYIIEYVLARYTQKGEK